MTYISLISLRPWHTSIKVNCSILTLSYLPCITTAMAHIYKGKLLPCITTAMAHIYKGKLFHSDSCHISLVSLRPWHTSIKVNCSILTLSYLPCITTAMAHIYKGKLFHSDSVISPLYHYGHGTHL